MYILFLVEECPEVSKYETTCPSPENAGVDLVTVEDWISAPTEVHLLNLGVKAMLVKAATMETGYRLASQRGRAHRRSSGDSSGYWQQCCTNVRQRRGL